MHASEVFKAYFACFMSQYMHLEREKMCYMRKFLQTQQERHLNAFKFGVSSRKMRRNVLVARIGSLEHFRGRMKNRRIWHIERTSSFWEIEVPLFSDEKFKQDFRIKRCSFFKLCEKLSFLRKEDTNKRKCIPLEKLVGIALYSLGSSSEYRTVANLFGVGRTTVGEIVLEVCDAIIATLMSEYLNGYPLSEAKCGEIVAGFEQLGFPQCFGAIDGCHIEICPSKDEAADYYNYKGWYSVILFASVDYRCRSTYISVGTPGRNNDSSIFESSSLKKFHENNSTFMEHFKVIENVQIPIVLIGDSAFALSKCLLKPFPYIPNKPVNQKIFNYKLSKCRRVVENAFGHLKARFRKIGKGLEIRPRNSSRVIKACCILHNFLNEDEDSVWNSWLEEFQQMEYSQQNRQPQHNTNAGETNIDAKAMRIALASYFGRERRRDNDATSGDSELVVPAELVSGDDDSSILIDGARLSSANESSPGNIIVSTSKSYIVAAEECASES